MPSRQAVGEALLAWLSCTDPNGATNCASPPEQLTVESLSCRRLDGGRVLCRYSAAVVEFGRPGRWAPECARLSRNAQGVWQIESFPDAEICAF